LLLIKTTQDPKDLQKSYEPCRIPESADALLLRKMLFSHGFKEVTLDNLDYLMEWICSH